MRARAATGVIIWFESDMVLGASRNNGERLLGIKLDLFSNRRICVRSVGFRNVEALVFDCMHSDVGTSRMGLMYNVSVTL